MTAFEDSVGEEVMKGRSIHGLYPPTDEKTKTDFAAWRKAKRSLSPPGNLACAYLRTSSQVASGNEGLVQHMVRGIQMPSAQ